MEAKLRHLQNQDVKIPYFTWEVERPRSLLVLIHGLKSHAGWFLETGADFAERGVKVYVFDRRGSGMSECERGHISSYRDWLRDIRAMIRLAREEHPDKPLQLLGHCFGAKLALAFAILFPNEADALALIAPPQFSLKADIHLWEKAKVAVASLAGKKIKIRVPVRDDMFTRDPEKCRFIDADSLKLESVTAQFYMQTFWIDRLINRSFRAIELPTLVLLARDDEVVDNLRIQTRLFARLNCRRKALEIFDCYHDLLFEPHRLKVIERITEWVGEFAVGPASADPVFKPLQVAGEAR